MGSSGSNPNSSYKMPVTEQLKLTNEWDKIFPLSDKVNHQKVTYVNRYGITLAADLYTPKEAKGKLPGIAVGSPYGAVKEQASGIYAMKMAMLLWLLIHHFVEKVVGM